MKLDRLFLILMALGLLLALPGCGTRGGGGALGGDDDDDGTGDDDDSASDDDDSAGTDADGDGVTVEDGDCDDSDPTVYPGAPEIWDDGIDQDCDGIADAAGAGCVASFTVETPDGSSTTLDACVDWSLAATFEYDPDDPPEVRSVSLRFSATDEIGFECEFVITQNQMCGTGYYDQADAAGTTTYALMDCTGIPDDYEYVYSASTGYIRFDSLDAGSVAGNFTGQPLPTTVEGYLAVDDGTGVSVSGNFSVSLEQVAQDAEEQTDCAVSDGDEDDDGEIGAYFDGTDCNDSGNEVTTGPEWQAQGVNLHALCGGTFEMGCTAGQSGCNADESPAHSVWLTRPFWMGGTEVTQGQWQALMGSNPSYFGPNGGGASCGADCPVEMVNWYEALALANAMSAAEDLAQCYSLTGCTGTLGGGCGAASGCDSETYTCTGVSINSTSGSVYDCGGYRLPTEAEWEYAARAGTDLLYAGSNAAADVAWTSSNSDNTTHPVAGLQSNAWGIYDMSGSVYELTADWYDAAYYDTSQTNDPEGPSSGSCLVRRGGSFGNDASLARSASRYCSDPVRRRWSVGFRLVRTVR